MYRGLATTLVANATWQRTAVALAPKMRITGQGASTNMGVSPGQVQAGSGDAEPGQVQARSLGTWTEPDRS